MLCCWFAVGLIEEELVKEGRVEKVEHHERERQSIVFRKVLLRFFFFAVFLLCFVLFFNIVLMWKIVGVSEVSVIYNNNNNNLEMKNKLLKV